MTMPEHISLWLMTEDEGVDEDEEDEKDEDEEADNDSMDIVSRAVHSFHRLSTSRSSIRTESLSSQNNPMVTRNHSKKRQVDFDQLIAHTVICFLY